MFKNSFARYYFSTVNCRNNGINFDVHKMSKFSSLSGLGYYLLAVGFLILPHKIHL